MCYARCELPSVLEIVQLLLVAQVGVHSDGNAQRVCTCAYRFVRACGSFKFKLLAVAMWHPEI